ncbi:MAG TPA: hypothetical protein VI814_15595 [Candidatus Limnocylindria bacterium]
MINLLTSDAAILFFSSIGLALTTVSIVRDMRAQRDMTVVADNIHQFAAEDARAKAA